jgi:zinc transport system substrate-binding protein
MLRAAALLLVAAVAILAACGSDDQPGQKTTVVAAFYPLAWAAEQVAGDTAEIVNLTPPGVEPHDLELSPRDVEQVRDADLVLYLGGGFMPALEDAVADHPNAIDLLQEVELLEGGAESHADEEAAETEGHEYEEHALDPHVWLDPSRLAAIARRIAEALGSLADADDLVSTLEDLDAELAAVLANCERREIVTSHAAFGYLAQAYDLRQIALTGISPESEPSPRALERLVSEVEETGATTVFFESLVSPRLAETVARETGARTAALDPLEGLSDEQLDAGGTYVTVMRANLQALREALECR